MISAWGRHAYDIFILGSTKLVRRIFRLAACKMGITFSSPSSPEPDDSLSTADRLNTFLDQKPLKMANMLKLARLTHNKYSLTFFVISYFYFKHKNGNNGYTN